MLAPDRRAGGRWSSIGSRARDARLPRRLVFGPAGVGAWKWWSAAEGRKGGRGRVSGRADGALGLPRRAAQRAGGAPEGEAPGFARVTGG